eukprot:scaffold10803_cov36-Tisochrysis_lutea.AAC.3
MEHPSQAFCSWLAIGAQLGVVGAFAVGPGAIGWFAVAEMLPMQSKVRLALCAYDHALPIRSIASRLMLLSEPNTARVMGSLNLMGSLHLSDFIRRGRIARARAIRICVAMILTDGLSRADYPDHLGRVVHSTLLAARLPLPRKPRASVLIPLSFLVPIVRAGRGDGPWCIS